MNSKKHILFLSQTAVFDMGEGSGKEVIFKTLEALSKHFIVHIFAPGLNPQIANCLFYPLPSYWFQRLKRIPFVGYCFNYVYVWHLKRCIHFKFKQHRLNIHGLYMAGPWMSHIGYTLFKTYPIIKVVRYFGVNWKPSKHDTIKEKIRFYLKNKGYKNFHDLVIMTNDGTKGDEFLRKMGCPDKKVRFWRNGLSIPDLLTEKPIARNKLNEIYNIPSNHRIMLAVSRLAAWKRVDRILLTLANLLKTNNELSLIIVGDGEERNKLSEMCSLLNIQNHVVFAGSLPHSELDKYYCAADVFLSMYDYSNAGNPLFEAMAHGCPIITLNGTGMQAILPRETGILLPEFEVSSLSEQINDLLKNDSKRILMGQNARKHAMTYFLSWEERMQHEINEILLLINK